MRYFDPTTTPLKLGMSLSLTVPRTTSSSPLPHPRPSRTPLPLPEPPALLWCADVRRGGVRWARAGAAVLPQHRRHHRRHAHDRRSGPEALEVDVMGWYGGTSLIRNGTPP